MALEKNLTAVPPVLITVNSTTEGVLTIANTCGFYVKQIATLSQAPFVNPISVQIKRVVDDNTLWVGPISSSMEHNLDVSAYTVASGSYIFASEQPKAVLPMESRVQASYMQEPSNSWRVTPVDCIGNQYDKNNPFPVTPFSQFFNAITLGALGISVMIAECTKNIDYDEVDSVTVGNVETLTFLLNNVIVDVIEITYGIASWTFKCLGPPVVGDFLIYENGNHILLEDGSGIYLLE